MKGVISGLCMLPPRRRNLIESEVSKEIEVRVTMYLDGSITFGDNEQMSAGAVHNSFIRLHRHTGGSNERKLNR